MIVLLDLNYTLVENSTVKKSPFIRQIEGEVYRQWLIDLLKESRRLVVLITARPSKYVDSTLQSLREKTGGWQPDLCCFNEHKLWPPASKKRSMEEVVFPEYGRDELYFAIESNPKTSAMYRGQFGIDSIRADDPEKVREAIIGGA